MVSKIRLARRDLSYPKRLLRLLRWAEYLTGRNSLTTPRGMSAQKWCHRFNNRLEQWISDSQATIHAMNTQLRGLEVQK